MVVTLAFTPIVGAESEKDIQEANKYLKEKFKLVEANKELKVVKVKTDELGFTHVRLQQIVDGIPVFGNEYIVHFDKNKDVYASNGKFNEKAKNYKQKGDFIKLNEAIEIAKKDVGYEPGTEVNQEDLISAQLYLYEVEGEFTPAYLVRINWLHEDSFGDWRVFVDAVEGSIVAKFDE
jgi:Zn-dependent metalloprotease